MSSSAEGSAENEVDFSLSEFLEEHSQLFTVLGVFGAISVYLTRISQQADLDATLPYHGFVMKLGITASLFIFLLLAFLIQRKAFSEYLGVEGFALYVGWHTRDSILLNLFFIPFYFVVAAVLYSVLSAPRVVTWIFQIFSFLIAIAVFWRVEAALSNKLGLDVRLKHLETVFLGVFGVLVFALSEILVRTLMGWSGYSRQQFISLEPASAKAITNGIDLLKVAGTFLSGLQAASVFVIITLFVYIFNIYVLQFPKGYLGEDYDE